MAPQVLVLGMPRTGTQSIGEALRVLGHENVYHMTTVGPNNHHDKWVTALEAKFEGKGTMPGRKEFDELLGDFDAVSDFPCSIFYRELMTAYPEARVILSSRAEDLWFESMSKTLNLAFIKAQAEPSKLAKMYNLHLWGNDFEANGRQAFRTHMEGVHAAAAELNRDVLVFDPSQGWDVLCEFLEKPVPEGIAYPRKDMWIPYKNLVKEVEAGRLTEDSITIKRDPKERTGGMKSAYIYTKSGLPIDGEGLKSAYIYTKSGVPAEVDGIKSAYIYTKSGLPTKEQGIKAAYIYTKSGMPIDVEGIKAAYIYTKSGLPTGKEGIKAAYIYTNSGLPVEREGIKAAYIYTKASVPNDEEGIKAAYIYTKSGLPSNKEGIKAAYIYTKAELGDNLIDQEGIKAAYIYTKSEVPSAGMKAAYIYTQAEPTSMKEGIKAAYIYT